MRHMVQPKITYAFLILAVGLMLTDLCKLVRAPSEPVFATADSTHQIHKF
ncbi:MAG TPA: hypothetical protein VK686_23095 [Bryobacteraceae bacterium]|jgi:hypothetical protein|nr:hypothetical protein [Bryobacteraceae bacterium]